MGDAFIRIDLDLPIPAYRQIVDGLRALIVEGVLVPGDRMPTVRDLAVDLSVHHNTVAEAYRQLAAEGWLELGRRRGATVMERPRPRMTAEAHTHFSDRLRELIAKARADGLSSHEIRDIFDRVLSAGERSME